MTGWLKVLAVLFGLPVFAIAFFQYAPTLVDQQVRDTIIGVVKKEDKPAEEKASVVKLLQDIRLDYECSSVTEESRALISNLGAEDICAQFGRFAIAQFVAALLILLGLIHILVAFVLAKFAQKSRRALLNSFRLAWKSATVFSLIILLGQTLLGGFTAYYFPVVLAHRYWPQLILILVIGGLAAFYKVIKMLFSKIPIETKEPTSQEIQEHEAPALFSALHDLASRLQIAPPETVLVGLNTGFYVTEFPVRHVNGVSRGRTLHLSAPMMKQMTKNEVLAIVGHELGHFKGEDTIYTSHMTPLLVRADHAKHHMIEGGVIGWPATQAMNVFSYFFDPIISRSSRERELVADTCGASVTDKDTAASALVRYFYQNEAYMAAFHEHLVKKSPMEASLAKYQDELKRDEKFWEQMAANALPHPYDTHPPLALRLENLGFKLDDFRHRIGQEISTSGYDVLLGGKADLLQSAMSEQANIVKDNQERLEIMTAKADELSADVIRTHFPQVTLKPRSTPLVIAMLAFSAGILIAGLLVARADETDVRIYSGLVLCVLVFLMREVWLNLKGKTLTYNHLGVQQSNWKHFLKFEDVAKIQPFSHNGNWSLSFILKEKRPPIGQREWFVKIKRKAYSVNAAHFKGKQEDTVNTIIRYYVRELNRPVS